MSVVEVKATKGMLRKIRKILGPKEWQLCSSRTLIPAMNGGWKRLEFYYRGMGFQTSASRTWKEALEKLAKKVNALLVK